MTSTKADLGQSLGVPSLDAIDIKHAGPESLGLDGRPAVVVDGAPRVGIARQPLPLPLTLTTERSHARTASANKRWARRRYAATRDIGDGDAVDTPSPVLESMRRERAYRRALSVADGFSSLGAIVFTAAVCGAQFSALLLVVPVVAVAVAKVQGLYDRDDSVIRKSTVAEWREILRAAAIGTIPMYLIWLLATEGAERRGIRVFALLLTGTFLLELPARSVARRVARARTADERCLIVGAPSQCVELAQQLGSVPGVELIGAVSDDDVDCSVAGIFELVEQLNVQRIVVVPHAGWGERGALKLIQSSKWLGVRVSLMPTVMTVIGSAATVDELDNIVLLGVPRFGLSRSSFALKRTLDVIGAAVILLFTAPIFALIALAITLDTKGPAFFRQQRVGREGTQFTMYKFRSMVDGAEKARDDIDALNETSGLFKMKDDPRITRVGKLLRKTYLDELPQLLNVLKGDMSLVGPRPLISSEDALLVGFDRHRSRLTPGMTGPWQLRGPINASLSELAKLDYMYASNWSVWGDAEILIATVARVVRRGGH